MHSKESIFESLRIGRIIRSLILMGSFLICFSSCKIYKFSDTSVNPNIRSVSVENFPNLAPLQQPSLAPTITDKLKQRFLRETNLQVIQTDGDIQFTGSIIGYDISPVAVSGNETVAQNRLTIRVKVDCVNKIEPENSFNTTFTDGDNYDAADDLTNVEDVLIESITEKIVENIFNKAFVNW